MPTHNGFSCHIEVDGKQLEEYEDKGSSTQSGGAQDKKVVHRWIAVEEGQVRCRILYLNSSLADASPPLRHS